MIRKICYFGLVLIFSGAVTGFVASNSYSFLKTIVVKIEQDRDTNIWRVRDNTGKNRGTLKVKKKDKIKWQAKGSDVKFTFSKPVAEYFTYDEGQFADGSTQFLGSSKTLSLTVKQDAPSDTLIYEVYVVKSDTFVVGNSPPKLIIN